MVPIHEVESGNLWVPSSAVTVPYFLPFPVAHCHLRSTVGLSILRVVGLRYGQKENTIRTDFAANLAKSLCEPAVGLPALCLTVPIDERNQGRDFPLAHFPDKPFCMVYVRFDRFA